MPTPKEILAVERPKGTIVKTVGNHYYVIKRTSKYVNGRRVPVDLETVGKIIDFKFVPKKNPNEKIKEVEIKDYANVEFAASLSTDIYHDLLDIFSEKEAKKIYCIALIRSLYGDVKNRDLAFRYKTSFISEKIKTGLSKQVISKFLMEVGMKPSTIDQFIENRILKTNGVVVVDGMLKNYNGNTDLSKWSRKGKVRGSRDISILYALDTVSKEPLGFSVNSGNMLDNTAFKAFISKYNLTNSIIIGDKGFTLNDEMRKEIAKRNHLKYIIPIKRNLSIIKENKLLQCEKIIHNTRTGNILSNKTKIGDVFYYTYIDPKKQYQELNGNIERRKKKGEEYDSLIDKKESYGSVIFESNLDEEEEIIYSMYQERWEIETMFNFYKNIIELKNGNVHTDYSLIAQEFINFITVIIAIRMKNKVASLGINEKYSFKQILMYLKSVKKVYVKNQDDWVTGTNLKYVNELVEQLNIPV